MENKSALPYQLSNPISDMTQPQLQSRTKYLSKWEGASWALLWGFGESYLVPFAIFLKASNATIAFISTSPILIMAIAHIFGAVLLDRAGHRKPIIFGGFLTQGLAFLPIAFLPIFPEALRIPALIFMVVLAFLSVGIAKPSWVSLMGDVVEENKRGAYFSSRERIVMSVMVTATLMAGVILQAWEHAGKTAFGFALLFSMAALGRCGGSSLIRYHYEAPFTTHATPNSGTANLLRSFTRNTNFIWFTLSFSAINGVFSMAAPFFAVYMLRDLHWTYVQFTLGTVIFMASQTLFIRWWGDLCDQHGTRSVMIAASTLLAPFLAIWVITKNTPLLLLSQILSGAAWSGLNLAASNFIYDAVGQEGRAKAFSFHTLVCGLFSATGGILVGSQLADHLPTKLLLGKIQIHFLSPIPLLFLLTALGCLIVRIVFFPRFSEVKPVAPASTATLLLRLATGQPLKDLLNSVRRLLTACQKKTPQK